MSDAPRIDGWLWRKPHEMRWHFRSTLTDRSFPEDAVFQPVAFVEPAPTPREENG
jgi:hypothetical protein